ncbi:MAG: DUF4394 domain-containing protein [Solirubrobacteraceae bacterium]|nr:DUF4394 domain-containing protein [Solirubrobacteraceae bacterium]
MSRLSRCALLAGAVGAVLGAAPAAHATKPDKPAGTELVGVAHGDQLVRFTAERPALARHVRIRGLGPGESVVGLDVRPATGQLEALSDAGRLYVVDPRSGVSTPVGAAFAPSLDGEFFGFDVNPVVDRLRVTSDANENLRLLPDTGQAAAVDGSLNYDPADASAGRDPAVVGSAYTNPDTDPATGTTLYDIDAARDALVIQDPPNAGGLKTVGSLGVKVGYRAGFDIAPDNTAYAAFIPRGGKATVLHTIDLSTGAATAVGRVGLFGGVKLDALAVLPAKG